MNYLLDIEILIGGIAISIFLGLCVGLFFAMTHVIFEFLTRRW